MYYGFYYKTILKNFSNNFNLFFLDYIIGKLTENEFKAFRLQSGLYRQSNSYMYRIAVSGGFINFYQILNISYISFFYDKKYFHLTTRTNVQLNWIKFIYFYEILIKLSNSFLHSIQTSGNCLRNITSSSLIIKNIFLFSWIEILRQWFNLNFEFLFLPRKFKIFFKVLKDNERSFKVHDLSIYIKKNFFNKFFVNILIGGGLGRTPILGFYILKFLHWKKLLIYIDKILKIYNIYGIRNNIYKSRIKILFKLINSYNYLIFINKEFNYCLKSLFVLTEKEINYFFCKKDIYINKFNFFNKKYFFNYFFLFWLKNNYKFNFLFLPIKNNNKSPGDITYLQVKILFLFLKFSKILKILNRQNFLFLILENIYFIYLKLKKYFYNVFNFNFITDIISCPGKDYCSLANASSISISQIIQSLFSDFNSLIKVNNLFLNISGCINSCGHHHISDIGILGVSKNKENWYQIFFNNNCSNYNFLSFSKPLSSFIYFKISFFFIKIFKSILKNEKKYNNNDNNIFFNFYRNLKY